MRLRCTCGRNLADVTRPAHADGTDVNPGWTLSGLVVTPRPGVQYGVPKVEREDERRRLPRPRGQVTAPRRRRGSQEDHRAWHEANQRRTPLDERDGDAADWQAHTYTLRCRCGHTWQRRGERIAEAWSRLDVAWSDRRVVPAVLDRDV